MLFWEGAFEKIVFGIDGRYYRAETVLNTYKEVFRICEISQEVQDNILGGTAARLLGLNR